MTISKVVEIQIEVIRSQLLLNAMGVEPHEGVEGVEVYWWSSRFGKEIVDHSEEHKHTGIISLAFDHEHTHTGVHKADLFVGDLLTEHGWRAGIGAVR